ncbi:MAG TPA: hypothetical protein VGO86_02040 [Candidatus Dormibacteraeota bacterium]|jgi:hypothetical protein
MRGPRRSGRRAGGPSASPGGSLLRRLRDLRRHRRWRTATWLVQSAVWALVLAALAILAASLLGHLQD